MDLPDERRLLELAVGGDDEALGMLLGHHRPYLVVLASRELDPLISARLSGSDIAQQTYLDALKGFDNFRGTSPREFMAWLKQILANNLVEATRVHLKAQKRSIHNEYKSRESPFVRAGLPLGIVTEESSPSSRAMRDERAVELAHLMESLPEDQFEVIRLRYIEGWSISQITDRMERSESAVAGLLKRGLQKLRDRHSIAEEESHE